MSLRIICTEAHYFEAEWAKASVPTLARIAPYITDLGSRTEDNPDAYKDNRPHLQGAKCAIELGSASIESRIEKMDANGIDTQVLSIAQPIQEMPVNEAVDLSRRINDRFAEIAQKYPRRFAGFFTLPWQNTSAAVQEAERAVARLGLNATQLLGRAGEHTMIDDPQFDSILAKLEELDAPIYLHPGPPLREVQQSYYSGFNKDVTARFSLHGYGWHNESGIQMIRLILSGTLDRYPKLKIISGHWGEMVPFFLNRMDDMMPMEVTGLRRTISQTYRDQVYVTPSGMFYTPNFLFCKEVMGIGKLLFSMDYPYITMTGARTWLENLPVSDEDRGAFAHLNAEKLLKLP